MAKQPIENVHVWIDGEARVYIRRRDQTTREYTPTPTSLSRLARVVRLQRPTTIPYKDGWSAFPHLNTDFKIVKVRQVARHG